VQEPEKERCADQGGDHANGNTNRARDRIGEQQEERAADRREWQHGAWVGADGEACKVRHNEANEADQAGQGDGRGGGESGEGNGDAALATHIDAEMRRTLIAK
jgi:hypothetical protein